VTGRELQDLLHGMVAAPHTRLPLTHTTKTDTWDALRSLDADPAQASSVVLIYSQRSELAANQGVASGWNREHLWPKSYGVGTTGADTTDLHALRPADWNVNAARGNLPFDWCNASTACRDQPAHAEADSSTGKDAHVFMPPEQVRGDVARAIFYMAIRYDGSEPDTERLRLSNCPCKHTATMGVLSALLEWHAADPPSALEMARNDKVCRDYQGNRNPFVDKPELVARVFGTPQAVAAAAVSPCPPCEEHGEMSDTESPVLGLGGGGPSPTASSRSSPRGGDILSAAPRFLVLAASIFLVLWWGQAC
jgi:endonuclease I